MTGKMPVLKQEIGRLESLPHVGNPVYPTASNIRVFGGGLGPTRRGANGSFGETFFAKKVFPNPFPKTPKWLTNSSAPMPLACVFVE